MSREFRIDKSKYCTSPLEFAKKSKGNVWFVDTESTGFEPWARDHIYSVQIMDENGLLGFLPNTEKNYPEWKKLWDQPKRHFVAWNTTFDINFIRQVNGGKIPNFARFHDGMVLFRMLDQLSSYKLKDVAKQRLGVEPKSEDTLLKFKKDYAKTRKINADQVPYDMIPNRILIPYALDDTIYLGQLFYMMYPEVRKHQASVYKTETEIIPIFADLQWQGVNVDADGAYRRKATLLQRLDNVEKKIWKLAKKEWNIRSHNDTSETLESMGYKLRYNVKDNAQTDSYTLKRYKTDLTDLIAKFHTIDYDISHYLTPMSKANNGIIHPGINQVGALTVE